MPRGGKRPGAGRKPKNQIGTAIAKLPVEVEELPRPNPRHRDIVRPEVPWLNTPEAMQKAREAKWSEERIDWDKPVVPQLPPLWQIAVEVYTRTGSITEGAKAAGLTYGAVSPLQKRVWWQRAVRECVLRYVDEPREVLAELVPKAVNRYHLELDPEADPGDWRAAQDVLDRAWGKPVARVVMEERKDISLTFVDRPDTVEGEVVP